MTTTPQGAVAGYFSDHAQAAQAVRALMGAGFVESEIDLAPCREAAAGMASYHDLNTEPDGGAGGALLTVTGPRAAQAVPILESAHADLSRTDGALTAESTGDVQAERR